MPPSEAGLARSAEQGRPENPVPWLAPHVLVGRVAAGLALGLVFGLFALLASLVRRVERVLQGHQVFARLE